MVQTPTAKLDDMLQEEEESLKSYFVRFNAKLIACETILDEKAKDALWSGLLMETPFWRNFYNKNLASYHQLVSIIQNEIQTEYTIENQKKVE